MLHLQLLDCCYLWKVLLEVMGWAPRIKLFLNNVLPTSLSISSYTLSTQLSKFALAQLPDDRHLRYASPGLKN